MPILDKTYHRLWKQRKSAHLIQQLGNACTTCNSNKNLHLCRNKKSIICDNCRKDIRINATKTHGKRYSLTYDVWRAMLQRCNNKNNAGYKNYGGRGITVCQRWNKFENFYDDMGDPPEGYSLDRIDNDGDYEPNNCRWTTADIQVQNRRISLH